MRQHLSTNILLFEFDHVQCVREVGYVKILLIIRSLIKPYSSIQEKIGNSKCAFEFICNFAEIRF